MNDPSVAKGIGRSVASCDTFRAQRGDKDKDQQHPLNLLFLAMHRQLKVDVHVHSSLSSCMVRLCISCSSYC